MSTLSSRVRTSADPLALRQEIDAFLDYHVARLFGEEASAVAQSRSALGEQVGDNASPAFKSLYADLLAERLTRRTGDAPAFNQLNAAIVMEEVARLTQSLRFAPLITQLAGDDDAAVAIWAAKAAYPVYPELLQALDARARDRLTKALVDSVIRFPDNGVLAEEVYRSLSMRTVELRPPERAVLANNAPFIVPAVQDLIAFRVGRYTPSQPAPDPHAEFPGLVVLTNNAVWPAQTDQQKARTVAVLRDLMLQAMTTANNMPQQSPDRRELIDLIKRIGSAFEGISSDPQPNAPPLLPEVHAAARRVTQLGTVPAPAVLTTPVQNLDQALQQAFPGLPAPQLSQRADDPAAQPATGPGTQPSE